MYECVPLCDEMCGGETGDPLAGEILPVRVSLPQTLTLPSRLTFLMTWHYDR